MNFMNEKFVHLKELREITKSFVRKSRSCSLREEKLKFQNAEFKKRKNVID